jgi:hypothetical protein
MASLEVREWLTYVPIFVDFSQVDSFSSWLRTEYQGGDIDAILDEINAAKDSAWISPDESTRILESTITRNGFEFKVELSFRLRTLCVELVCRKPSTVRIRVAQAFDEIRKAEKELDSLTQRWRDDSPVCNVLVVQPFYEEASKAKDWIAGHVEELNFFPDECRSKSASTTSLSKLIEADEHEPVVVTGIRDSAGLQRRLVLLCGPNANGEPDPRYRVRWVFFTSLLIHVLERANKSADSIMDQMSRLESDVLRKCRDSPTDRDFDLSVSMLQSIAESSKTLFSLENALALSSDDVAGAQKNFPLVEYTARSNGVSHQPVEDEALFGNVVWISSPSSSFGYGVIRDTEEVIACHSGYCCILCDERRASPPLSQSPPLDKGVVGETHMLVKGLVGQFTLEKSEIERCMTRVKSFVSGLLDLLSTQVNVQLNLSHSQVSKDQKAVLSKMETLLEESAKDRQMGHEAKRAVEILSLLFASFVLGEISSNFIIWDMQQIWSTGAPWFAYVAGFLLSVAVACAVFLPVYSLYLRRMWRKRASISTTDSERK